MKEIRKITEVVPSNYGDENNNSKTDLINDFDREPGYYQVIRPMLAAGHENELVYWLKNFGLLANAQTCNNTETSEVCDKAMSWTPARVSDLYQWKCGVCNQKRGIRDYSVFCDARCSFKNAIRIFLGWCKGNYIEYMANMLDVKKGIVGGLYNVAANIAMKYIKSNIEDWKIGGENVIVVVDIYPEGCSNPIRSNRGRPILCISEVKSMPQKYWFQAFERNFRNTDALKKLIRQHIKEMVAPGSILVVPETSTLCSYDELQCLRHLYPLIFSIDTLSRHNTHTQTILGNLAAIWKSALDICEQAQHYSLSYVQQFLVSEMWKRRYGRDSFEILLYQMSTLQ